MLVYHASLNNIFICNGLDDSSIALTTQYLLGPTFLKTPWNYGRVLFSTHVVSLVRDIKITNALLARLIWTDIEITATTNTKWYGASASLFCGPKERYSFTGFWDHPKECNKPWANPRGYYDNHDCHGADGTNNSSSIMNLSGRTDVEGYCFWGRGVIQTTGVFNFGRLNYYLATVTIEEGRASWYHAINFRVQPDAICASEEHKEPK